MTDTSHLLTIQLSPEKIAEWTPKAIEDWCEFDTVHMPGEMRVSVQLARILHATMQREQK